MFRLSFTVIKTKTIWHSENAIQHLMKIFVLCRCAKRLVRSMSGINILYVYHDVSIYIYKYTYNIGISVTTAVLNVRWSTWALALTHNRTRIHVYVIINSELNSTKLSSSAMFGVFLNSSWCNWLTQKLHFSNTFILSKWEYELLENAQK